MAILLRTPRYTNVKIQHKQSTATLPLVSCDNVNSTEANAVDLADSSELSSFIPTSNQLNNLAESNPEDYSLKHKLSTTSIASRQTNLKGRTTLLHWRVFATLGVCFIWGCSNAFFVLLPKYAKQNGLVATQTSNIFVIGGTASCSARVLSAIAGNINKNSLYVTLTFNTGKILWYYYIVYWSTMNANEHCKQ